MTNSKEAQKAVIQKVVEAHREVAALEDERILISDRINSLRSEITDLQLRSIELGNKWEIAVDHRMKTVIAARVVGVSSETLGIQTGVQPDYIDLWDK